MDVAPARQSQHAHEENRKIESQEWADTGVYILGLQNYPHRTAYSNICRGSRESGEPTVLEKSNLTDLAGDSFFCRDSLFEFGTRLVPGDKIQWKRDPGG